jgi:protein-S-isoprenylcysteine O-methyltransferase Ste14
MIPELIENIIHWLGGLLAYTTLAVLLYGLWRGTQRQAGLTTGRTGVWLHSPLFYIITSVLFLTLCYLGWIPLPWSITPAARFGMLVFGSFLYFPGLLLVSWARLALGKNYIASTGLGVQLFAGHELVTSGPFAILRHPMYTGLIIASLGSLLIYFTWTTLFFACLSPFITLRARREEAALAEEFGDQWHTYRKQVPAFIPRFTFLLKTRRIKL